MSNRPASAEDFMRELAKEPAYREMLQAQSKRQETRMRAIEMDAVRVRAALEERGIRVGHLHEVLDARFIPLPHEIVNLLLRFLPTFAHESNQEWAVRLIGATRVRYDARPLAALYDTCTSENVKWAIGNTLSITTPAKVDDWIMRTLRNKKHGRAREMLCDAAARQDPDAAREILKTLVEEMPIHSVIALGKCGGRDELAFLQHKLETFEEWSPCSEVLWQADFKRRCETAIEQGGDIRFWNKTLEDGLTNRERRSRAKHWKKYLVRAIAVIERRCSREMKNNEWKER